MKIDEILRKSTGRHLGYQLAEISETDLNHDLIREMGMRRLRAVPGKVTAFLHRDKIKGVFKSNCFPDKRDEYYIVESTDGTLFHLNY